MIILALACVVTVASNADTFRIARTLSNDPSLRRVLVAQAQLLIKEHTAVESASSFRKDGQKAVGLSGDDRETGRQEPGPYRSPAPPDAIKEAMEEFRQLGIPFGWKKWPDRAEWPNKILGLLLTVLAVSLGTPFWFDTIKGSAV